jgi:hypothetical protein
MLAEFIEPEAPVIFPAADGVRVMPFSQVMPLAFEMKLKNPGPGKGERKSSA